LDFGDQAASMQVDRSVWISSFRTCAQEAVESVVRSLFRALKKELKAIKGN